MSSRSVFKDGICPLGSIIIGFTGDADGKENHLQEYIPFFQDCDVLIAHIGAIHKTWKPDKEKHLYLEGAIGLIKNSKEKCLVLLGEFGLELGDSDTIMNALIGFIPKNVDYRSLIKNIYDQLNNIEDKDEWKTMMQVLAAKFVKINESRKPIINLQMIFPIFLPDGSSLKDLYDILQSYNISGAESEFSDVWWIFYKTEAFKTGSQTKTKKIIIQLLKNWLGESNFDILLKFGETFIPLLGKSFLDAIQHDIQSNFLLRPSHNHLKKELINFALKYFYFSRTNDFLPDIETSELKNSEIKDCLYTLCLITMYFYYCSLGTITENNQKLMRLDKRIAVCKYIKKVSGREVIPVHQSYKLIFLEGKLREEGYCNLGHFESLPDLDINTQWTIKSPKGDKKELISIIPENRCKQCYDLTPPPPDDYPDDDYPEDEFDNDERALKYLKTNLQDPFILDDEIFFSQEMELFSKLEQEEIDNVAQFIKDYFSENSLIAAIIKSETKSFCKALDFVIVDSISRFFSPYVIENASLCDAFLEKLYEFPSQLIPLLIDTVSGYLQSKPEDLEDFDIQMTYWNHLKSFSKEVVDVLLEKISPEPVQLILNILNSFKNYLLNLTKVKGKAKKNIYNTPLYIAFKNKVLELFIPLIENEDLLSDFLDTNNGIELKPFLSELELISNSMRYLKYWLTALISKNWYLS